MPWVKEIGKDKFRATYRDAAGKRHTKVWPTKSSARTWALDREAEVRNGTHRDPKAGRITVGAWWEKWFPIRVIEANTRASYDSQWRNHVKLRWEKVPLESVSTDDVEAWVAKMLADGVGAHTVRAAAQLLAELLSAAVTRRPVPLLMVNPAHGVRLPTAPRKAERFLTDEEYTALLDGAAVGDDEPVQVAGFVEPWRTLVEFLCHTGLRWGEMAGLDVTNVDFLRRQVHVRGVLTETRGVFRFKAYPKSAKSRRTLPLPQEIVDSLAAHLQTRPARSVTLPDERDKPTTRRLVFTGLRGSPLARNWNARVWRPKIAALKLPAPLPTPHDMRHTFASWLVQDGVDLSTVQAKMGHESIATTMRYAHLAPDADARIVTVLEARAARRAGDGEASDTSVTHGGSATE
jgi:integrase